MNIFTCTTRLYKDAEQRFSQSGDSIVSFKGAVDAGYGQNKTTTWIKFTIFGKRGESVLPYLKDKTQVAVSGELANREYTDKEGQKRYSLEVRVSNDGLTLLGSKQEGQQSQPERPAQKPAASSASFDDLDDDIPF
jgi:single-strand DNA-binding protein